MPKPTEKEIEKAVNNLFNRSALAECVIAEGTAILLMLNYGDENIQEKLINEILDSLEDKIRSVYQEKVLTVEKERKKRKERK